jgi:hypothetical protein
MIQLNFGLSFSNVNSEFDLYVSVSYLRLNALFDLLVDISGFQQALFAPTNSAWSRIIFDISNLESLLFSQPGRELMLSHLTTQKHFANALVGRPIAIDDREAFDPADQTLGVFVETYTPPLFINPTLFAGNAQFENVQPLGSWNGNVFMVDDVLAEGLLNLMQKFNIPVLPGNPVHINCTALTIMECLTQKIDPAIDTTLFSTISCSNDLSFFPHSHACKCYFCLDQIICWLPRSLPSL